MRRKILFIINPIAGIKKKTNIRTLCEVYVDRKSFDTSYVYTEYAGHGYELAKENKKDHHIIVAVGGDGTINEIARAIIHTECILGIIPLGSGNGLARHLGLPLKPKTAIKYLNRASVSAIDTCTFNDRPFLCTAGIGFEAAVSSAFDKAPTRGIATYLNVIRKLIKNFEPMELDLPDSLSVSGKTFSLTFANAEQFGNNAVIAPNASLEDGVMNVCHTKPFPQGAMLGVSWQMMRKAINKSKYYQSIEADHFEIDIPEGTLGHIDGDPIKLKKSTLTVKVLAKSLRILS